MGTTIVLLDVGMCSMGATIVLLGVGLCSVDAQLCWLVGIKYFADYVFSSAGHNLVPSEHFSDFQWLS